MELQKPKLWDGILYNAYLTLTSSHVLGTQLRSMFRYFSINILTQQVLWWWWVLSLLFYICYFPVLGNHIQSSMNTRQAFLLWDTFPDSFYEGETDKHRHTERPVCVYVSVCTLSRMNKHTHHIWLMQSRLALISFCSQGWPWISHPFPWPSWCVVLRTGVPLRWVLWCWGLTPQSFVCMHISHALFHP